MKLRRSFPLRALETRKKCWEGECQVLTDPLGSDPVRNSELGVTVGAESFEPAVNKKRRGAWAK